MRKDDLVLKKKLRLQRFFGVLVVLAATVLTQPLFAATVTGNYQLTFSESDKFLYALDMFDDGAMDAKLLAEIEMQVSCDNPHNRIRARNRVAMKVTNDAGSQGDLTSISLQINQAGFDFGTGDEGSPDYLGEYFWESPYSSAAVDILGSSVSLDGSLLTIDFSGLAPGESAIFRLDFDPESELAFPFPDYREVLFGLDSDGNSGVNALGETTGTFTMGAMSATTIPATFAPSAAAAYINGDIRAYHAEDPVGQFGVTGSTVPEPTTALLLMAGVASCLGVRRRSRR